MAKSQTRLTISISVLVVFVAIGIYYSDATMYKDIAYHRLNCFLNKLPAEMTTKEYLAAARKKYDSLKGKSALARGTNTFLYSALKQLVKLEPILDDPKCDGEEYKTLSHVTKTLNSGDDSHVYKARAYSILDRILYDVSSTRTRECIPKYPKLFEAAYSSLNDAVKNYAEYNVEWLRKHRTYMSDNIYMGFLIEHEAPINSYSGRTRIIEAIIEHVKNLSNKLDPRRCEEVDFNLMLDRYLVGPCKKYVETLWTPILESATFDSEMFAGSSGYDRKDAKLIPYYEAFAHSRYCLIIDKALIDEVLETHAKTRKSGGC